MCVQPQQAEIALWKERTAKEHRAVGLLQTLKLLKPLHKEQKLAVLLHYMFHTIFISLTHTACGSFGITLIFEATWGF